MSWFTDNQPSGAPTTFVNQGAGPSFSMPAGMTVAPTAATSTAPSASPADLMAQDPGYQFRIKQAAKAVANSAAARGTLLKGGTASDIAQRVGDQATQEFQGVFNRNLSLAQLGLGATESGSANDTNYFDAAGNLITGVGNVKAAGQVAQGNVYSNAATQLAQLWAKAASKSSSGSGNQESYLTAGG